MDIFRNSAALPTATEFSTAFPNEYTWKQHIQQIFFISLLSRVPKVWMSCHVSIENCLCEKIADLGRFYFHSGWISCHILGFIRFPRKRQLGVSYKKKKIFIPFRPRMAEHKNARSSLKSNKFIASVDFRVKSAVRMFCHLIEFCFNFYLCLWVPSSLDRFLNKIAEIVIVCLPWQLRHLTQCPICAEPSLRYKWHLYVLPLMRLEQAVCYKNSNFSISFQKLDILISKPFNVGF